MDNQEPLREPLNVWALKPWWCQPWSIVLTTLGAILGSWFLGHRLWITLLVAIPMLTWMIFFVGVYPGLLQKLYEQERLNPPTP